MNLANTAFTMSLKLSTHHLAGILYTSGAKARFKMQNTRFILLVLNLGPSLSMTPTGKKKIKI